MAIITQEELLQYMYRETSPEKTLYIRQALDNDADLMERFQVLESANQRLEKIQLLSPDERSLEKIFKHAEKGMKAFS